MTIGERIRHYRKQSGISLRDLADQSGVARGYLSTLENGKKANPSMHTVASIAAVLGVTAEDLGFGEVSSIPVSQCRHFGIQWIDPIAKIELECVTCGKRFRVEPQP